MASLGRWSGGVTSLVPTTSWAAPASLVTTEDRNDGAAYGFNAATSTVDVPASDLADGYLVIGAYQTSGGNNRTNPSARWIQASGTGNFISGVATGYSRDTSNDNAYVRTWAFIDSPSASAQLQFQWRRDANVASTGTVEAYFEIIPLYYTNAAILSSTNGTVHGGATPTQITGFTAALDTGSIFASDQVTLADGKKYLCLGGWYYETSINSRTQRWGGFRLNGTKLDSSKGYAYLRNASNGHIGEIFSHALTAGTGDTMDMFLYRGDGVANGGGGADVDGGTTSQAAAHAMVFLELDDAAEFVTDTNAAQSATYTGSAASIGASVTAPNTSDYLVGADISGASFVNSTGTRYQGESEITVAGTAQGHTVSGDYLRNNQGSQDTFGWSSNNLSAVAATASDAITAVVNQTGQNGGNPASPAGWAGLFALDLDTLQGSGGLTTVTSDLEFQSGVKSLVSADSEHVSAARELVQSDVEFRVSIRALVTADSEHLSDVEAQAGRVYWVVYPAAQGDPVDTDIIAGTVSNGFHSDDLSPTATNAGFQGVAIAGLTAGTDYKLASVWSNGASNSNVAISALFTTTGGLVTVSSDLEFVSSVRELVGSDNEARSAVLELVSQDIEFRASVFEHITSDLEFLSNVLGLTGTLYWAIYPSATADPDAPTLIAQSDGSYTFSQSTSPTETTDDFQGAPFTGLTGGTEYQIAVVWHDGVNTSNVSISAPFTTLGGLVTVTSDLEFRSAILELVTSDSEHIAAIREVAQSDLEFVSSVRERVSSDLEAICAVAELVAADAEFLSGIREPVTVDLEFRARVLGLVGSDMEFVSSVRELSTSDREFLCDVLSVTLTLVTSDLEFRSSVRQLATADSQHVSQVAEWVNADSQHIQGIRTLVSNDREFLGSIRKAVTRDLEMIAGVLESVSVDSEHQSSLRELVANDREFLSNVLIILTDRILREDGGLKLVRLLHENQLIPHEHVNQMAQLIYQNEITPLEQGNDLELLQHLNELIQMDRTIH